MTRRASKETHRGSEVSCAVLGFFFDALDSSRLPPERLAQGTGYALAHLRDPRQRVSWHAFCAFMANAAEIWSEDQLLQLGARALRAAIHVPLPRVARMLLGASDLYMLLARARGVLASGWFSCFEIRTWEVAPRQLIFEIGLDHGYPACPEFHPVMKGMLSAVPSLLGLPQAAVELELAPGGALFHVQLPAHVGLATNARRSVRRLRTLRVAVEELQAAHAMLNAQYEELRRTQASLRASEARFRTLIEHSSDFIMLTDRAGEISYLSPSAQRIIGYASAELVRVPHAEFAHPDDREAVVAALSDLAANAGRIATLRYRFRTKDRYWIWLEGTAKNMLDDPRVGAIVINYRDVSDRVRLEEQLLQSRKLESIGRLAGGIAHDFNNLLTGVLSSAELTLYRLKADDPAREAIEQIADYVKRGADLTRQLLAFARKQVVQAQTANLNGLVQQTRALLDRLIGDQVEILTDLDETLGNVEVDPNQFEQVIINLAINARDAMPYGGTLRISTRNVSESSAPGAADERLVLMTVSDTGVGMDEQTLAHIFEPFFTTKGVGQGTGLGLATCHGIVTQAGGRIEVSSRPGAGTTFRVYLPRVDQPVAASVKETTAQPVLGSETLLLVDDEPAVRKSTSELLRSLGYNVLTADGGLSALELASRYPRELHAVVTDIVMPKLNGPELVERLRHARPGIKALYMSGYAVPSAVPEGALVIQKPFEMLVLAVKLRELLGPAAGAGVLAAAEPPPAGES